MPLVIAAYWTRRPGPSPNGDVRQPIQGLVEVVESHLSQRGQAQQPGRLLAAVAPQRMADPAAQGRGLVHAAGRGPGDGVLGIDNE